MSHPSPRRSRIKRVRQNPSRRRRQLLEQLEQRQLLVAGPDPVLLIPGFAASFADIKEPGLDQAEIDARLDEWYTHRGLPPDESLLKPHVPNGDRGLVLEPHGQVYQSLVKTLENVGYVQGESLFIVPWDWRTPVAPLDSDAASNPDGQLSSVTVAGITDNVFESGLDYLGFMLKHAADTYAANHPGQTLDKVDVITHSTGGLITRAYIQSPAYGQGGLPTISDFIMSGTPNVGLPDAFSAANDDWNINIAGRACDAACRSRLRPDAGWDTDSGSAGSQRRGTG